jgi:hypothetical protein
MLLIYAKELHSILYGEQVGRGLHHRENLEDVLARIDPLKPPSAEELAGVIQQLMHSTTSHTYQAAAAHAVGVLERARAAGMLKGDGK